MNKSRTAAIALISAAVFGSAHLQAQERKITPLVRVAFTLTDTGYDVNQFTPHGYEAGLGLALGAVWDDAHEITISTGFTRWDGKHNRVPGQFDVSADVEQIPLFLNYRYRLALDNAKRPTLFAGPTVGYIHEKLTSTIQDLGTGFPAASLGASSASDWILAYGGGVGVEARLGNGWSASISAQALRVEDHSYTTNAGFSFNHFDTVTRPEFALGVSYTW